VGQSQFQCKRERGERKKREKRVTREGEKRERRERERGEMHTIKCSIISYFYGRRSK